MPVPTEPEGLGGRIQSILRGRDILDLLGWDPRDATSKSPEEVLTRCRQLQKLLHPDKRVQLEGRKWVEDGSAMLNSLRDFIEEGFSNTTPAYRDAQDREQAESLNYDKASDYLQKARLRWSSITTRATRAG